jgi:hypothetical protein
MPAESKSQRRLMGACSHGAKYASCPKGMTKAQMRDFASTPEKGLPMRVKKQGGGVIAAIGKPKDHLNFRQMGIIPTWQS